MAGVVQTYLNWVKSQYWGNSETAWPIAVIGAVLRWRERVRQRRDLALLDDAQLRDIGVTRAEAARECSRWF